MSDSDVYSDDFEENSDEEVVDETADFKEEVGEHKAEYGGGGGRRAVAEAKCGGVSSSSTSSGAYVYPFEQEQTAAAAKGEQPYRYPFEMGDGVEVEEEKQSKEQSAASVQEEALDGGCGGSDGDDNGGGGAGKAQRRRQIEPPSVPGPIGIREAAMLRELLFVGGAKDQTAEGKGAACATKTKKKQQRRRTFNAAWLRQGFGFRAAGGDNELRYGVVQHEGGPCGVLAVVQAELLRAMLGFGGTGAGMVGHEQAEGRGSDDEGRMVLLAPSEAERRSALLSALGTILWRCAVEAAAAGAAVGAAVPPTAVLATLGNARRPRGGCPIDDLVLHIATSERQMLSLLERHGAHFSHACGRAGSTGVGGSDGPSGAILLACSAVLSRGLLGVADDMNCSCGANAGLRK